MGRITERRVSFDSLQAARNGFGMIGNQKFEIKNENDFIEYYFRTGGINSAERVNTLIKTIPEQRAKPLISKRLKNVLDAFGKKKLDDFIAQGGAEAISRMLPAGKIASYRETYDAVAKWLNQEI